MHTVRVCLVMLFVLATAGLSQADEPKVHTPEEWREDLLHLVSQIRERHPAPWMFGASEEAFVKASTELSKNVPHLSDGRIVLEIFKLLAMIDDSHSEPFWNTIPPEIIDMRVVPVRFYYMNGGIYVTQAQQAHQSLLGSKLIEINGCPVDEILNTAMEYMSGDNAIRRRTVAVEVVLTRPGILHALGLAASPDQATYTFKKGTGARESINLKVLDGPSFPPVLQNEATVLPRGAVWSKRKWEHVNDQSSLPLWQQDRGRRYWFEYLEDERVLYMRFKRVIDDPAESFDDFTDRMFKFIEEHQVEKLIIDARKNKGGYAEFGLKFVDRLSGHELGKKGRLFMIVGRGSKSATPFFAWRLELAAHPTFVGEISGGRPTPFGNTFNITFPNSGVSVRAASLVFKLTDQPDPRKTITPHITVGMTIEDFRNNRDPVLAAALNSDL